MNFLFYLLFICLSWGFLGDVFAITVDNYLKQVESSNDQILSIKESISAAHLRARHEGTLLISPQALLELGHSDDKTANINPQFYGERTRSTLGSFSLMGQGLLGFQGKISYSLVRTKQWGVDEAISPLPDVFYSKTGLEFSYSLGRNFLGKELKSQMSALYFSQMAQYYAKKFELRYNIYQAENAYWKLALHRKIVGIQEEAVKRAEDILAWAQKRVSMELGNKGDELTARSGLEVKRLELQMAKDTQSQAARTFNAYRGIANSDVVDDLDDIEKLNFKDPNFNKKAEETDDVRAYLLKRKAQESKAGLDKEKLKNAYHLQGRIIFSGREVQAAESIVNSITPKNAEYAFGLKVEIPLFSRRGLKEAYDREVESAGLEYKRKRFENEQNFNDLHSAYVDAKRRYHLFEGLEKVQKEKLDYEKGRLYKGSTMTYQVLQFEIDYANAQIKKFEELGRMIDILAQMKLFVADNQGN